MLMTEQEIQEYAEKKYPIDELRDCRLTKRRKLEQRRILIERLRTEKLNEPAKT